MYAIVCLEKGKLNFTDPGPTRFELEFLFCVDVFDVSSCVIVDTSLKQDPHKRASRKKLTYFIFVLF